MARYIDADAYAFPGDLINEPTADVEEVKHGVWYKSQFVQRSGFRTVKDFLCNRCEKEYSVQQPSNPMNYCPYCGAKMDGGKEE